MGQTLLPSFAAFHSLDLEFPAWRSSLEMYTRFAIGLRRHLRAPLSIERAVETVKGLNAARESNFLCLLKRSPKPRIRAM